MFLCFIVGCYFTNGTCHACYVFLCFTVDCYFTNGASYACYVYLCFTVGCYFTDRTHYDVMCTFLWQLAVTLLMEPAIMLHVPLFYSWMLLYWLSPLWFYVYFCFTVTNTNTNTNTNNFIFHRILKQNNISWKLLFDGTVGCYFTDGTHYNVMCTFVWELAVTLLMEPTIMLCVHLLYSWLLLYWWSPLWYYIYLCFTVDSYLTDWAHYNVKCTLALQLIVTLLTEPTIMLCVPLCESWLLLYWWSPL